MRFALRSGILFAVLILLLASFVPSSARAQFSSAPSFGLLNKKQVTLKSRLPPIYNASGKTVDIAIGSGSLEAEIVVSLEKQLTQNDSSIQVGGDNPDLKITCQRSHYTAPNYVTVTDNEGSTKRLVGDLSVLFNITEVKSKKIVKADIATIQLLEDVSRTTKATPATKIFGITKPASSPVTTNYKVRFNSPVEAEAGLVNGVTLKIASYLVNTSEAIEVPLAVNGALNEPDKFAVNGQWTRDLEELETLKPYSDPKQEAYRLYNIGVANEAIAYQTTDNQATMKYLEQASNDYGKALDSKTEQAFIDAQTRIKAALAHYEEIGKLSAAPTAAALVANPNASPPGVASITNQDVIDMVKAGLDEANVIDTIMNASAVNFDLTPHGLVALSNAHVNGHVVMAMKQKARGGPPLPRR